MGSIADLLAWFDWGDLPSWVATLVAFWGAWWTYRKWRSDVAERLTRDASRVWAVIEDGAEPHHLRARVVNSSSAVVYAVAIVITSGPDPREKFAINALAPGEEHRTADVMWAMGQAASAHLPLGSTRPVVISQGLHVALYFTDVHGQRWHRDWQGGIGPDDGSKRKKRSQR